nr:lysophospholipid acyltransferase family protein [Microlunatus panaciterrae]
MRLYWRIEIHSEDLVPQTGPVILAANHLGVVDGPLLVAISHRLSFAMAKREIFVGWLGRMLAHLGQISVDRHQVDKHAISRAIQVLRTDGVLAVFPEGVRAAGDLAWARGGAVYLAMVTGAPIVPVALLGTRLPGQTTNQLPARRSTIHVVYGNPIRVPQYDWPRRKVVVAEWTERVRRELADHVVAAQLRTGVALPGPPVPKPIKQT